MLLAADSSVVAKGQRQKPKTAGRTTAANNKFALCGLTFKFENLYLRFIFVMADKLVFINPAQRKFEAR